MYSIRLFNLFYKNSYIYIAKVNTLYLKFELTIRQHINNDVAECAVPPFYNI